MNWTDYAQAIGALATGLSLIVALLVGIDTAKHARLSAKQAELFEGAQAAIAWREQVFALHDRGLSPGQIRFIMHREAGGTGYETWNGRIDDLVQNMPRISVGDATSHIEGIMQSCDEMPKDGGGCKGPCQTVLTQSGRKNLD